MKKTYSLYVTAVLGMILALGLVVIGCDDGKSSSDGGSVVVGGGSSGGGGGGGHVLPSTNGLLTVTGLSAYNGKYIMVVPYDNTEPHLVGVAGVNTTTGVQELFPISGGQAAVKIYDATNPYTIKGYSGSHTVTLIAGIFAVRTFDTQGQTEYYPDAEGTVQASFVNGKATAAFTLITYP
jgi:hypothetical protein